MSSKSEKTIAKTIANAEKLHEFVDLFTDYVPENPEESLANYNLLITTANDSNHREANALSAYTKAVADRRKLFFRDADSLEKRYSDINQAIIRQYKEGSIEYKQVSSMIAKFRNSSRPKKDPAKPNAEHNSQSQKSFDSLAKGLFDLVGTIEGFSSPFVPINARVTIATLTTLYDDLIQATKQVNITTYNHGSILSVRNKDLDKLRATGKAIKKAVAGQYGKASDKYLSIKGIAL